MSVRYSKRALKEKNSNLPRSVAQLFRGQRHLRCLNREPTWHPKRKCQEVQLLVPEQKNRGCGKCYLWQMEWLVSVGQWYPTQSAHKMTIVDPQKLNKSQAAKVKHVLRLSNARYDSLTRSKPHINHIAQMGKGTTNRSIISWKKPRVDPSHRTTAIPSLKSTKSAIPAYGNASSVG